MASLGKIARRGFLVGAAAVAGGPETDEGVRETGRTGDDGHAEQKLREAE